MIIDIRFEVGATVAVDKSFVVCLLVSVGTVVGSKQLISSRLYVSHSVKPKKRLECSHNRLIFIVIIQSIS